MRGPKGCRSGPARVGMLGRCLTSQSQLPGRGRVVKGSEWALAISVTVVAIPRSPYSITLQHRAQGGRSAMARHRGLRRMLKQLSSARRCQTARWMGLVCLAGAAQGLQLLHSMSVLQLLAPWGAGPTWGCGRCGFGIGCASQLSRAHRNGPGGFAGRSIGCAPGCAPRQLLSLYLRRTRGRCALCNVHAGSFHSLFRLELPTPRMHTQTAVLAIQPLSSTICVLLCVLWYQALPRADPPDHPCAVHGRTRARCITASG